MSPRPTGPGSEGLSGYLPIAEHGIIGDLHTAALVGTDGTIDWFCSPRFDSPSIFGGLLDRRLGGFWRVAPTSEGWTSKQLYLPDTNVLITRFLGAEGVAEITDFMPIRPSERPRALIRRIACARGEVRMGVTVEPRFDYGRTTHRTTISPHGAMFSGTGIATALRTTVPLTSTEQGVHCDAALAEGDIAWMIAEQQEEIEAVAAIDADEAQNELDETIRYWRDWLASIHRLRSAGRREGPQTAWRG